MVGGLYNSDSEILLGKWNPFLVIRVLKESLVFLPVSCREPGLICRSCAGSGPKHQAARLDKVVCPAGVRGRERLSCPGSSQFPLPSPRLPPWVELQNQMGAEPGGLDSSPRPMQLGQGAGAGVLPVWASLASAGGLGGHDNITGALPQIDVKLST